MLDEKKLLEEKMLLEKEVAKWDKESYKLNHEAESAEENFRQAKRKLSNIKAKLKDIATVKEKKDKEAHLRLFKEEFCLWMNGCPYEYHHRINYMTCVICPRHDIFQWENKMPWDQPDGTKEEIFELMRKHGIVMVIMETEADGAGCWTGHKKRFFTSWDEIYE